MDGWLRISIRELRFLDDNGAVTTTTTVAAAAASLAHSSMEETRRIVAIVGPINLSSIWAKNRRTNKYSWWNWFVRFDPLIFGMLLFDSVASCSVLIHNYTLEYFGSQTKIFAGV